MNIHVHGRASTRSIEAIRMDKPRQYRYRSAVTGRYVKTSYAKRYPHLTVRERAG